ncbi:uncharacterized protein G2W53_018111 [Senna tora]|uniref:Uncharacterized protein n=1 Tax=Senna tora TaxID=362788 RepID=A0A834TT31_9FABA|nr:uncharacterized protein G2W53_018111 [Senna tora]
MGRQDFAARMLEKNSNPVPSNLVRIRGCGIHIANFSKLPPTFN